MSMRWRRPSWRWKSTGSVSRSSMISTPRARPRWPASRWLIGDDQHLGDPGRDRDRGRDQRWQRAVGVSAEQDVRARLRDPGAGDEGDRRPARLRTGQRARGHRRRHPGDRVGLRQPAGLLRLGRGQGDLRGRRAEAGAHAGRGAGADLPAQPAAGRRPRAGRLRAAQPGRQDPGDPPGAARPHPRRPHPPAGRLLNRQPAESARDPGRRLMTLNAIPDDRQLALAPPTLRPSIREDEIRAVLAKSDAGRSGPPRGAMRLAEEIADMSRATPEMQTPLPMMAIGVDYRQFGYFKRLAPSILYFIDGHTERRAPYSYAPTS